MSKTKTRIRPQKPTGFEHMKDYKALEYVEIGALPEWPEYGEAEEIKTITFGISEAAQ